MRGCTKHVDRVHNLKRIPQQVNFAFQKAMAGKPGPVYLDFPGDILYQKIDESAVDWSFCGRPLLDARPLGEPRQITKLDRRARRARANRSSSPAAASSGRAPRAKCRRSSRKSASPSTPRRKAAAWSPTTTPIPTSRCAAPPSATPT